MGKLVEFQRCPATVSSASSRVSPVHCSRRCLGLRGKVRAWPQRRDRPCSVLEAGSFAVSQAGSGHGSASSRPTALSGGIIDFSKTSPWHSWRRDHALDLGWLRDRRPCGAAVPTAVSSARPSGPGARTGICCPRRPRPAYSSPTSPAGAAALICHNCPADAFGGRISSAVADPD